MTHLFKCPEPRDPRQITHRPADTILDHLIHITHRIELTEIHADISGDTHMPPLGDGWRETARIEHPAADGRPAYAFVTLVRDL